MEIFETFKLYNILSGPLNNISDKMTKTAIETTGLIKNLATFGKIMLPVNTASEKYQTVMGKTAALFNNIAVSTQFLDNKILQLSNSTSTASKEIGTNFYEALSKATPTTKNMISAIDMVNRSIKLSKSGFTDIKSVVDLTTSVLNRFGLNIKATEGVSKNLTQTKNREKSAIGEIGQAILQIIPNVSSANSSVGQVIKSFSNIITSSKDITQQNSPLADLGIGGTIANAVSNLTAKATQHTGLPIKEIFNMVTGKDRKADLNIAGTIANAVSNLTAKATQHTGLPIKEIFNMVTGKDRKADLSISGAITNVISNLTAKATQHTGLPIKELFNMLTGKDTKYDKKLFDISGLIERVKTALPLTDLKSANPISSVINSVSTIFTDKKQLTNSLSLNNLKENPLSTLFSSAKQIMSTFNDGVTVANPNLKKATDNAMANIDINRSDKKLVAENRSDRDKNSNNVIHIANITLPDIDNARSFIEELKMLQLSLGGV